MNESLAGQSAKSQGIVLSPGKKKQFTDAIRETGEETVRKATRLSRNSFSRALAGLPVRLGTLALLDAGLERLRSEG